MIENKLKELIIEQFGSVNNFSSKVDIPNSTINSILKRGIANANIMNIIKICKKLSIDLEELVVNENIVYKDYSNQVEEEFIIDNKRIDLMHSNNIEVNDDLKEVIKELIDEYIKKDNN